MFEPIQEATENFQKVSKDNYDAVLRSYGELNKGFQAVAARWTDFSKRSFEEATRAFGAAGRRKVAWARRDIAAGRNVSQPKFAPLPRELGRELINTPWMACQSPLWSCKRPSCAAGGTSESCQERT
jgi:hypothetical protein